MAKSLIPIDVIASNVCSDIGDSVFKHKFKIARKILDGYRDMHLFVDQEFDVKTSVLSVNNAIELPCDFVYETKVGILHNGNLAVLTLDKSVQCEKLNDTQTVDYLNEIWDGSYIGAGHYFYNSFRGGSFLGELYGMGRAVHNSGTYNIDKRNGVIYIGSHVPQDAEIVVEYKSDGVSDGLKLVPIEVQIALEYYGKAEWYFDRNVTQSQRARNRYEEEYNKVKRLYNFKNALYIGAVTNEMFSPSNY